MVIQSLCKMSDLEKSKIINEYRKRVAKFNLDGHKIVFEIKPVADEEKLEWFRSAIEEIVRYVVQGVEDDDQIGFTFSSENFKEKQPGWMSFRRAGDVNVDDVWNILEKVLQSNSTVNETDTFRLESTTVKLPRGVGKGRKVNCYNTYEEECKKRIGIIYIKNTDNLCLVRAIVVAKAHVKKDGEYDKIRRNRNNRQTDKVQKLLNKTGLKIPEAGAGIPELIILQQHLKKYKIVVYKHNTKGRELIFEGVNNNAVHTLNLLHHENHYNVITSLTAVFTCGYYCEACHIPYNDKNIHRCGTTCPCCRQAPPCKNEKEKECTTCHRSFRSDTCFQNHMKPGSFIKKKSVCECVQRCTKCFKTVVCRLQEHVCGEIFCKYCYKYKPAGQYCYMQVDKKKPKREDVLFIFFDFETRQERQVNGDPEAKLHEPNLCVFIQCCDKCMDQELDIVNKCDKCGERKQIEKDNTVQSFLDHVLNIRNKFNNVICISHNGQAFDTQFILKYIMEKTHIKSNLIMRGTKILKMDFYNVRFIDSLNFFPMALSALPQAFGLPSSSKKGYFPHLFNTKENENYVGPLPDQSYYCIDAMKGNDNKEDDSEYNRFVKWYDEMKSNNYEFNMEKEIVEYCESDVDILRRACLNFRNMFLEECDVCPFTEAISIAGACNLMFRRKFLKPDTIGVLPKGGYRKTNNQSKIALQWLIWEEQQRDITIQHSGRNREFVIPNANLRVDGYCAETHEVFEFHGCFYHGHDLCLRTGRDKKLFKSSNDTLNSKFEDTKTKTKRLKHLGYEVIEMWECEFRNMLRNNRKMDNDLENHPMLNYVPLNPRDAFYGGRTEGIKLYYKTKENEKIKYVDICSLYPWVCKYGKFPIGHPEVYIGEDCKKLTGPENGIDKVEGLIKCKILPPQVLYHPVLPIKKHNKLMFLLCRTCGELKYQELCSHSDDERALTGTWVADELRKAVEMGYTIVTIFEIWQYKITKYDKENKDGGLFVEFVNKFLKLKQEASGWPSACDAEEKKRSYIEDYKKNEGILLNYEKIEKNPGLRSLAKLMLNSFWGKFGQRENLPKTNIVTESSELFDLLTRPFAIVNYIQEINDNTVLVNWEQKEEAADVLGTGNCVIAAYVTTQARLKLYEHLEKLDTRCLYCDTDSCIYVSSGEPEEYEPPIGSFLGDMTDELEDYGPESYITEFVSGGPKTYAYTVSTKNTYKTICKFKGITQNYGTSKLANFETLKNQILKNREPVKITTRIIARTRDHDVITREQTKDMQPNFMKRKRTNDYDSVPYGYKRPRL